MPPQNKLLTSKLAAFIGIAHIEINDYLDDEAERAASVVDKFAYEISQLDKNLPPYMVEHEVRKLCERLPNAIGKSLYDSLMEVGQVSTQQIVKALVKGVPMEYMPVEVLTQEAWSGGALLKAIIKPFKTKPPVVKLDKPTLKSRFHNLLIEPIKKAVLEKIVLGGAAAISKLMQWTKTTLNPKRIADIFVKGISSGKNRREIARELQQELGATKAQAKRLARTEGIRVATESNLMAYEELGDAVIGYMIHAVLDERTRPQHRIRNGTVYYKEPEEGQKSVAEMPHPPIEPDGSVAWNCRCHLPGTKVIGNVKAISEAIYSGECVEIITRSGISLSVTANHPICTPKGIIPAASIKEGDSLFSDGGKVSYGSHDVQHRPALIEDIFHSLKVSGAFTWDKHVVPLEFHGDAAFFKGKVRVVSANLSLSDDGVASGNNGISKQFLIRRILSKVCCLHLFRCFLVSHLRPSKFLSSVPATNWDPSFFQHTNQAAGSTVLMDSPSFDAIFKREFLERLTSKVARNEIIRDTDTSREPCGFSSTSKSDASINKLSGKGITFKPNFTSQRHEGFTSFVPGNSFSQIINRLCQLEDSCFLPTTDPDLILTENIANSVSRTSQFFSQVFDRYPRHITTDYIVMIRKFHYDGPVYSVECDNGYYIASCNGSGYIYNKNCYLSPVFADLENLDKQKFISNAHGLIPDPLVYSDWWKTATDRQKRIAVGSRRFDAVTKKHGKAANYFHFIDDNGDLLSLDAIATETPADTQTRIMRLRTIMGQARLQRRDALLFGSV